MISLGPQNLIWMSYSRFSKKSHFFTPARKNMSMVLKKNVKMAIYHQETLPINIGFRGKHFTDKKVQILPQKLFFSFKLRFCPSGICDGKKAL